MVSPPPDLKIIFDCRSNLAMKDSNHQHEESQVLKTDDDIMVSSGFSLTEIRRRRGRWADQAGQMANDRGNGVSPK